MKISIVDGELILKPSYEVRLIGEPLVTDIYSSDGELYYAWQLKNSIIVGCSTDFAFKPIEIELLYIRESALERDDWQGNPIDGVYINGWVADYSKLMSGAIYQEQTIRQWIHNKPENIQRRIEQRKAYTSERNDTFLERLKKHRDRKEKPDNKNGA